MAETNQIIIIDDQSLQNVNVVYDLDEDVPNQQIRSQPLSDGIRNKNKKITIGQKYITLQVLQSLRMRGVLTIDQIYQTIQGGLEKNKGRKKACLKRRIYDSVNVLESLGIVVRQNKLIKLNNTQVSFLNKKIHQQKNKIQQIQHDLALKNKEYEKLKRQMTVIKNLIDRNIASHAQNKNKPSVVKFPVLGCMVNTEECQIRGDQQKIQIVSNQDFNIYGDFEMLMKCAFKFN